jgi:hypothetical protein
LPRDLDLHRLAPQRALQAADLPTQLIDLGPLDLAVQALGARGKELLAPAAQQRLGDVVSRQISATVFCPRSDASTSSVFCCAVKFR